MDILVILVGCIVLRFWLLLIKTKKPKKKRPPKPLGVLLFGHWFYWILANRSAVSHTR